MSWTRARGTHPARWPTSTPSALCWRRSCVPTSPRPWATFSSNSSPVLPSAQRLSRLSPSEFLSASFGWLDWLGLPKQRGCPCHMGRWVLAKASLGCQILTDHEHRRREVVSRSLKGLTCTESSSAQGWVMLVPCDR